MSSNWIRDRANGNISRRTALKYGATVSAGAAGIALVGCGDDDDDDDVGGDPTATTSGEPTATGEPAAPVSGGTLRWGASADIRPATMATYASSTVLFPLQYGVTDYLFKYRGFQLDDIVPHMAESYETQSPTEMTIKLREGITWHNGDPFTADDVVFNFETIVGSRSAVQELAARLTATAVDETTVSVAMDQELPSIFDLLNYMMLLHPPTIDQMEDGETFIGTGPFQFKSWTPTLNLQLERNPNYWQEGKPYLDGIDYQVLPSANLTTALEGGDIDYSWQVPLLDAKRLAQSDDILLPPTSHGFAHLYIDPNVETPPLDDKRIRRAISMLIDRERIASEVFGDLGPAMTLVYPDYSPGYQEDQAGRNHYNPQAARALLDEAGYTTDAPSIPLTFSSSGGPPEAALTILQNDLAQANVNSHLERQEAAVYQQNYSDQVLQGMWSGLVGYAGMYPSTFVLGRIVRPPNYTHYNPPGYVDFLDDIFTRGNSLDTMNEAMRDFNEFLLDECVHIPVCAYMFPYVMRSNIQGFNANVVNDVRLEELWIDPSA